MSLESLSGLKPPSECDPKELLITRETYELACLHVSLKQKDMSSFERHMAQLKTIYTDYSAFIPKSNLQMELQGLSLLSLLAQSKIAEFHTELELIPVSVPKKKRDGTHLAASGKRHHSLDAFHHTCGTLAPIRLPPLLFEYP